MKPGIHLHSLRCCHAGGSVAGCRQSASALGQAFDRSASLLQFKSTRDAPVVAVELDQQLYWRS